MALRALTFDDFVTRAYAKHNVRGGKRVKAPPKPRVSKLDNYHAKDPQNRPPYPPGGMDEYLDRLIAKSRRDCHLSSEDCRASASDAEPLEREIVVVHDRFYEDETYLNRIWASDRRPLAQLHAIHRNSFTRGDDGRPARRLQRHFFGKKANVR